MRNNVFAPIFSSCLVIIIYSFSCSFICFIHYFRNAPSLLNRDRFNEITAKSWLCDISELKKDFNFIPEYNLASGLEETIQWYQKEGWL